MNQPRTLLTPLQRLKVGYGLLLVIFGIFIVRLFYIQVIRHNDYTLAALHSQLKEYEIPAERGVIYAQHGDSKVPIVLNEIKYTIFADPKHIEDPSETAQKVAEVLNADKAELEELMKRDSRYAVLAKKQEEHVKDKLLELELKGIGAREAVYRTYPQGNLAAQLLGFVNDEGEGRYGIEQALQEQLDGETGRLRAITDARGIPLAANKENTLIEAKRGDTVELTIDVGMQQQLETILSEGVEKVDAQSGGAVIMEVATGKVKALANYPTYDPAKFFEVPSEDIGLFQNGMVSSALEVGSIMKPLTMAAALDQGVVSRNTTYYDPFIYQIDGQSITNSIKNSSAGVKTLDDILQLSLNTGATWMLMQMGGGEVNQQAREQWHKYMVERFHFGQKTGIEQGFEAVGNIPDPNDGFGLNIKFANTAFGQGMTATPIQMAAAYVAVLNGGNYYKPQLVEKFVAADGTETKNDPVVISQGTVKPEVSSTIAEIMEHVFTSNHQLYGMPQLRSEFRIGGKTGSAQIANPEGGYYEDRFNGLFAGFVGGDKPEYVIVVRVDSPKVDGYAGTESAAPIFVGLANMLIDNYGVSPKSM